MIAPTGRDGRPLVTTKQAAYSRGIKSGAFRGWARRHKVTAVRYRPTGHAGMREALWDLADIADAVARDHEAA